MSGSSSHPVSFQSRQHFLSQFYLPGDLIDAVAASQERLKEKADGRRGGGRGNGDGS